MTLNPKRKERRKNKRRIGTKADEKNLNAKKAPVKNEGFPEQLIKKGDT